MLVIYVQTENEKLNIPNKYFIRWYDLLRYPFQNLCNKGAAELCFRRHSVKTEMIQKFLRTDFNTIILYLNIQYMS